MKYSISFIMISVFLFCSCDPLDKNKQKCEGNTAMNYRFEIPYYHIPTTDTIILGDTLWIESKFGNVFLNLENNKTYTIDNFDFGLYGTIQDLKTNPMIDTKDFLLVDSLKHIDTISKSGSLFFINHSFKDNFYYWKRGIVLQKRGLYYFLMLSSITGEELSNYGRSITECPREYLYLRGKRMNGALNFYMLQNAVDPYVKSQGKEAFESGFFFYVK